MFNNEESEQIKKKIIEQINSWDVDDSRKQAAKNYIMSLSPQELEEFLEKNEIIVTRKKENFSEECIFCGIVAGKIQCFKVDEDDTTLAVLDIKPLSKGHVLVIPKTHTTTENIPLSSFFMALKIAKRLKIILNPLDVSISTSSTFNHAIINVVPLFGNELKKYEATREELIKLQKQLIESIGNEKNFKETKSSEKQNSNKKENKEKEEIIKLKRRIP